MKTKKELKAEYDELNGIKVTPRSSQDRGRNFERIICDLFENDGTLLSRPYYTDDNKSEQIDGAIEIFNRILLIEVKWVETNLAASDLYAFIGKVENKLDGTLGLFISKEQLSDNFINSITKGRRRNIILFHGDDIEYLFEDDFSIKKYLEYVIKLYSYNNTLHFSVDKYKKVFIDKDPEVATSTDTEPVIAYIRDNITTEKKEPEELSITISRLEKKQQVLLLQTMLKYYWKYCEASDDIVYMPVINKTTNAYNTILILLENGLAKETYTNYFSEVIETKKYSYLVKSIITKYLPFIDEYENRIDFFNTVIDLFSIYKGNYNIENTLSELYNLLWNKLDGDQHKRLLISYIDIFIDYSRKSKYEQKKFADKLLTEEMVNNKKEVLEEWINTVISNDVKEYKLSADEIERESRSFIRKYEKVISIIHRDPDTINKYIQEKYNQFIQSANS
jgi:hypothetical protein